MQPDGSTSRSERDAHNLESGPSRWRRLWHRLAFVLFLLLITEVTLQVFHYATAGHWLFRPVALPLFAPDAHRPWSVKKDLHYRHATSEFSVLYITNSQGFRVEHPDIVYARPKPRDRYRVLVMGPSFAFGWANDYVDTYGSHLQRLLQDRLAHAHQTVEVINAGVPGLHGLAQRRWYDDVGRGYEPDLVILMIYGNMVLVPSQLTPGHVLDSAGHLLRERPTWRTPLRKAVARSATAFYGYMVYLQITRPRTAQEGVQSFNPESQQARRMRRHLIDFRKAVEQTGGRLVVVHVPMSYIIHPEDVHRWKSMGYAQPPEAVVLFDAAACAHYAETAGITCLDLTPRLQEAAQQSGERLYFRFDVHWTPLGNRVAAEATAEALMRPPNARDDRQTAPNDAASAEDN